jgi:2-dehydro-3-deoxygluconokinase
MSATERLAVIAAAGGTEAGIRVVAVGECMIELRHTDPTSLTLGFAGDTYNAAVYLTRVARMLGVAVEVEYVTGLGDDAYSALMRQAWQAENVGDRSVTVPGARPGLYTVQTDAAGERSFGYWRAASAAAELFARDDWIPSLDADVVYLSGITLQLMPPHVRERLHAQLEGVRRQGGLIAFDTNYRPSGWPSVEQAQTAIGRTASASDIVFATFDDEQLLFADPDVSACGYRYRSSGAAEVIVKVGAEGAHVFSDRSQLHVPASCVTQVVDTTAAGDSFAGTYLAARLAGREPTQAARIASDVAAVVITRPGAITDQSELHNLNVPRLH